MEQIPTYWDFHVFVNDQIHLASAIKHLSIQQVTPISSELFEFWHELCIIRGVMKDDTKKYNCWEVNKCGREPDGANVHELGVCPTPVEERLDGIHGGKNAGRACWVVTGSMCGGKVQGIYAEKYKDCVKCSFYNKVKSEEHSDFKMTSTLVIKLQKLHGWDIYEKNNEKAENHD